MEVVEDGGTKYLFWCSMFYDLIDNQNAFYVHFPFAGAYMDQPAITMLILQIIKSEYVDFVNEQSKKH